MTLDPDAIRDARERLERIGGEALRVKMGELFVTHGTERMDELRAAWTQSDVETVQRCAHSMKSSAANLGFSELREIAREIERSSKSGELVGEEDITRMFQAFGESASFVKEEILGSE